MNRRDIFASACSPGVVLLAPEVAQVPGEQLAAAHAAAVVVQVVVHEVGVGGVHTRVLVVLVLRAVALVVLVKHVVVVHQRIGCVREKLQEELLHLRVEHALHLRRVVEVLALGLAVRQCDAKLVHALGAVGREAWVVLLHSSRVAHHLRKIEASPHVVPIVLAQRFCLGLARRILPECVGRDDGVRRLLVDGVAQRKRQAAFRGFDVVRPNMFQALRVATKPEAPPGLDGARGSVVEHVDNRLSLPLGNLDERRLGRRSGSRIPVPIERHVGQASVRSDGWWLAFCQLEGRHIDRRIGLRNRRNLIRDAFEPVHSVLRVKHPANRGTQGL